MKRILVLAIVSLTMSFPATAQVNNQAVPNSPFVVQPASFFQPFQSTAPFYINSPYHANPTYIPNPPYNPTPNYSDRVEPPIPAIEVPEARPMEAAPNPNEQMPALPGFEEQPVGESQPVAESQPIHESQTEQVREKPSAPQSAAPAPTAPLAVLALRSGGQLEVQSYVIAGDTLLISVGTDSRRMKVSDLDVAKTERLNQQRGIQFVLPQ